MKVVVVVAGVEVDGDGAAGHADDDDGSVAAAFLLAAAPIVGSLFLKN